MNETLARYNQTAIRPATGRGARFLDVWVPFITAARQLATASAARRLWSDGVHLSELGDALMQHQH